MLRVDTTNSGRNLTWEHPEIGGPMIRRLVRSRTAPSQPRNPGQRRKMVSKIGGPEIGGVRDPSDPENRRECVVKKCQNGAKSRSREVQSHKECTFASPRHVVYRRHENRPKTPKTAKIGVSTGFQRQGPVWGLGPKIPYFRENWGVFRCFHQIGKR